ncbi:hypothetical protein P3X46_008040 [Hevea brasiliensis]|uniref:Uncharacterized protein n=1 Tax=Hevea brasiliensis TaxID=3981 RepID=A0ABQ9MJZ9_HEVBR|nr:probable membrane-associated kinase regulator 1 [Hevea brasiliensis]KAJ9179705.1 hypothetical protein P3X46_008040 [Hevea brasiliensis]
MIMESKTFESRDPKLEDSFSFSSCYDFNSSSSLTILSDNDQTDDDDEDSFIEISLDPAHLGDGDLGGGRGVEDCDDDEMEHLRSFSSGVFLPTETKTSELCESVTSCTSSLSSSSSSVYTFSSSSTEEESQRNSQVESKLCNSRMQKTIRSKVLFPAVNRFVNTFTSSFRESSEIDQGDGRLPDANQLDLAASSTSKPSKITTTTITINNGAMMNFFTIFRALKVRTLLASFLKASKAKSTNDKGKIREKTMIWSYNQSLTKPTMDKGSMETKQGKRSRVLELNLDSIRRVLEAMNIRNIGRRERRTKSCPGSTKSSPIHQRFPSENYTSSSAATDNNIQAAIAHCKRSFGPDD